jgi:hypothetical protein
MNPLPRVRSGLLRHPLDEQVLVYDSSSEQVHLLDPATACVLDLLEEGGWTREGIAIEIAARTGVAQSDDFLSLAIDELRRARMLETAAEVSLLPEVTRRDALRRLALSGASAMMVPTIATLMASNIHAQSQVGVATACAPCSPIGGAGGCAPPNTCINGTGGARCSGGSNPVNGLPTGATGQNTNSPTNCGAGGAADRQAAANARCCSGSATVHCNGSTTDFTCN